MVTAGREPVRVDDAIARMRAVVAGPCPGDPGTADPELVRAALAGLSHDDQRLLWLKHVDTADDQTIADRTGLPLGAVQRRLRQAERGLSAGFAAAHARAAAHASDACATTRRSLADYSRQRLPARARRVLEEHLYGCQDCMRAFIDVRQAGWALRDAAPLLLAGGAGLAAAVPLAGSLAGATAGSMVAPVVGPAVVGAAGAGGGAGGALALVGAGSGLDVLRDGARAVLHSGSRAALVVGGGAAGVVIAAGVAAALALSGGPTGPLPAADGAGPAVGSPSGAVSPSIEEVSDDPTTPGSAPTDSAPTGPVSPEPAATGAASAGPEPTGPASVPADLDPPGTDAATSTDATVPDSAAGDAAPPPGGAATASSESPATPDEGSPTAEASPSAPVVPAPASSPTPTATPSPTASPSPSVEPTTTTSVVVTVPGACGADSWQRYAVSLTAADGQTRMLTRDDAAPASGLDGVWARPADDVRGVPDGTWLLRSVACRSREITFTLTTPVPTPATATPVRVDSR